MDRPCRSLGIQAFKDIRPYIEKIAGAVWIMALNAPYLEGRFRSPGKILIRMRGYIRMAAQTKGITGQDRVGVVDQQRALSGMHAVAHGALVGCAGCEIAVRTVGRT